MSDLLKYYGLKKNKPRSLVTHAATLTLGTLLAFSPSLGHAATHTVMVGQGGFFFVPSSITIEQGDDVMWIWSSSGHSSTSGIPGAPSGFWDSGIQNMDATFSHTFNSAGSFPYYCTPHGGCCGMVGSVTVTAPSPSPTPTATSTPSPSPSPSLTPNPTPSGTPAQPLNISTRMDVKTNDQVLIGGFIITGNEPKEVLLRAIGPSLSTFGIPNVLVDPVLELHGSDGSQITMNDNWRDTQESEIEATGLQPTNDLESAIIATLDPGTYTAIVSGNGGVTGIGLVEGYDLDQAADSQLANISTRGFVEAGANVMIGGFILGGASGDLNVLVRALGPSLTALGVDDALADPTLELHDAQGTLIQSNDNWKDMQEGQILATGLPPTNDLESAIFATLSPGAYTAIVAGNGDTSGVALVEVYSLE